MEIRSKQFDPSSLRANMRYSSGQLYGVWLCRVWSLNHHRTVSEYLNLGTDEPVINFIHLTCPFNRIFPFFSIIDSILKFH